MRAILLISLLIISNVVNAQCDNWPNNYGSATAPATGNTSTFATDSWMGEYSPLSGVVSGQQYTFTISYGGCITLRTTGGALIAFGSSPLVWTATFSGNIEVHWNTNCSTCGTNSSNALTQVSNTTTVVYGCTDPTSNNYNPLATVDDGSCTYDGCSMTTEGTVSLTECADIGSAAFNTNAYMADGSATQYVTNNAPSNYGAPDPTCWNGYEWAGDWIMLDLDPGADVVTVNMDNVNFWEAGNAYEVWMTFYQGSACNTLTEIACETVMFYDWLYGWLPYNVQIDGLDTSQPLWVYVSSDDAYTLSDIQFNGMSTYSTTCSSPEPTSTGCNVGAIPDASWTGPNNNGASCTGGTWYSNENTVYYTFTATATNATLDVENTICNDGTNGEIQIGVWEDCASVGTYGSGFVGCAVGSGTLTMPALTVGQSYILVADGQAGDLCTWDFVSNGIILPVELINLRAERFRDYNLVYWSTASEYNSDYFIVERSLDGISFEPIGEVDAAGTTNEVQQYNFQDYDQRNQTVYYRLKQFDQDGNFEYHGPRPLYYNGSEGLQIAPNPTTNISWLKFDFKVDKKYDVSIRDLSGREVLNKTIETAAIGMKGIELNLESFDSGVYLVSVYENGLPMGTKEVVKK